MGGMRRELDEAKKARDEALCRTGTSKKCSKDPRATSELGLYMTPKSVSGPKP